MSLHKKTCRLLSLFFTFACAERPASVSVTPRELVITSRTEVVQLRAAVLDRDGEPIPGMKVSWKSLNEKTAQVDGFGRLLAASTGDAEIQASCRGAQGSAFASVRIISSLLVEPQSVELPGRGSSAVLKAVMTDENGKPVTDLRPRWSCLSTRVCKVESDGKVFALGTGATFAVVQIGKKEVRAAVIVKPPEPESVTVLPASAQMKPGEKLQLSAVAAGATGAGIEGVSFLWSSSYERAARVSADGLVAAVRPGEAVITAEVAGKSGSSKITVK